MSAVQIQVKFQHVDARFAQEPQLPSFGVPGNELAQLVFTHPAFAGDARYLELCVCWGDVRIEP